MEHLALYRKWRPMVFNDVIGQSHITNTLKNEINTGRLSHAFVFSGTRGTGKTTTAKILSRAVNCENSQNGNPCNTCKSCKGILDGSLLDVVEMDAASNNGVDDIRVIRDEAQYAPADLKYKVYIIDEVHMLSASAFNALLKTLEEPPKNVLFILATTEVHKIPITILSRCQRFDFKRITPLDIEGRLKQVIAGEGLKLNDDAVKLISRVADGSLRDALSILDQVSAMGNASISFEEVAKLIGVVDQTHLFTLADDIMAYNPTAAIVCLNELVMQGRDIARLTEDVITHFRNLLLCTCVEDPSSLLDFGRDDLERLQKQSAGFNSERIIHIINTLAAALAEEKTAANKRTVLEIAFIRLCTRTLDNSVKGLSERISELERLVALGSAVHTAQPPQLTEDVPQPEPGETTQAAPPEPALKTEQTIAQSAEPLPEKTTEKLQTTEENLSGTPLPQPKDGSGNGQKAASNTEAKNFQIKHWAGIVEQINQENPMLGGFISLSEPYLEGEVLHVLFADGFSLMIAQQNDGEAVVKSTVMQVCALEVTVRFEDKSQFEAPKEQDNLDDIIKWKDKIPDIMKIIE